MHASSLENMRLCYRRFIMGGPLEAAGSTTVLDLGGADLNGTYRDIFQPPKFNYLCADMAPGPGVEIVLQDPYALPVNDASIDIVISGQMLEHCEFFWLAFGEMARVVKPEGYIFLIAPSAGPIHRYPVDCYRFYPDAFHALARHAKCQLIDVWRDERGPWCDLVGVFRRGDAPTPARLELPTPVGAERVSRDFGSAPEEEVTRGKRSYCDILSDIHNALAPSFYLEIGVRHGRSLALANAPAIGVNSLPEITVELPSTTQVVTMTSDEFFSGPHEQWLRQSPDLVFVDGMHLFEYALRDFMHVERLAQPDALVVFDDIFPNHPAQSERERRTRVWTGDVWKLHQCLRENRPDLFLLPIDASPAGLLLVCGLDKSNRTLWDRYNPIVRAYSTADAAPPPEVLARKGASSGSPELLAAICGVLRAARSNGSSAPRIVGALRAICMACEDLSPPHGGEM